jgi:hypothetical protein
MLPASVRWRCWTEPSPSPKCFNVCDFSKLCHAATELKSSSIPSGRPRSGRANSGEEDRRIATRWHRCRRNTVLVSCRCD